MSSGRRTLVYNTQERALSVDQNRAQAFMAQDTAEMFRLMLDAFGSDDLDAGAVLTAPTVVESPLRAEVFNGLLVKPQIGSLDLQVDAGVLYALAPDAGTDDSNYKYIRDAGIAVNGVLLMTANASGSTRIDVVECQVNAVPTIVTDNRDIFNPTNGLFAASVVTKETAFRLAFRVRAGTPGSGFPGTASGWLPLAVATVPNGTTTCDTITFWDVRPLLSDREFAPFALTSDLGGGYEVDGYIDYNGTGPVSTLTGHARVNFNGRRLGGRLRRGSPGTDGDSIVLTDAANQAADFSLAADALAYVYLMTPFGLPRWARYTDFGSGVRQPRSPRGIPVATMIGPDVKGNPSSAIQLPASFGFNAATSTSGILAVASRATRQDATHRAPTTAHLSEKKAELGSYGDAISDFAAFGLSGFGAQFRITPGTHFPKNARRIKIAVVLVVDPAAAVAQVSFRSQVFPGAIGTPVTAVLEEVHSFGVGTTPAGTYRVAWSMWIPVPYRYPSAPPATFDVLITEDTNALAVNSGRINILGWEF